MNNDPALAYKLDRAIEFMETFIEHKDNYTSYLVEKSADEIKLGANGVAIIMYTEYMDVFVSQKYVNIVRKLANGILELQNHETGEYWHILEYPGFARKKEYRTVYYDGEATFALARAYTYTKEQKYLDAAKLAVDNMINKNYIKHRDHWVAYSLFEVTKYINDVKYYEFALRNADENLYAIYNRETSFHTYLEMLMASWRTYKRALKYNLNSDYINNYEPSLFARTIYFRARHMLNGYFYPEYAMYMKSPEKIVGSFMVRHHNFRVRIDDIQHFIGGYFFYSFYYNEIRENLSEQFIDELEGKIKTAQKEKNGENKPVPMIYHLNKNLSEELTAVENTALIRFNAFKNAGIKSKIVTVMHNLNLHEIAEDYGLAGDEIENLYDYVQNARSVKRKKIPLEDLFPLDVYKWRRLTFDDLPNVTDYKIYLSKKRIAYVHYADDVLVYINRFDSGGRKTKRCFYDSRGFLSVEKYLDNDGKTVLETFFTPDGKKIMEKHYNDSVISAIRVKLGVKWKTLQDKDALIAHFLDSLATPKKDFFIVDKNIVYTKALTTMRKNIKKAAFLHSSHTKGNETLTDDIKDSYSELFNSLRYFDAIITTTEKQKHDIVRRFNNPSQVFAVPFDFDEGKFIAKWRKFFAGI
jgi:hypothetical protein